MGTWTTIDHDVRRKYDLSLNEYAVCDTIYILSHSRICTQKQEEIGEPLGISRKSVYEIIQRLINMGFVIKCNRGFVTSEAWNEEMRVTKGYSRSNERLQHTVTKSYSKCNEKLLSSIRATKNNINNNKIYISIPEADKVKLTESEYKDLCNKYGESSIHDMILDLDNYIVNGKGARYKDHKRVIETWYRKRGVLPRPKPLTLQERIAKEKEDAERFRKENEKRRLERDAAKAEEEGRLYGAR